MRLRELQVAASTLATLLLIVAVALLAMGSNKEAIDLSATGSSSSADGFITPTPVVVPRDSPLEIDQSLPDRIDILGDGSILEPEIDTSRIFFDPEVMAVALNRADSEDSDDSEELAAAADPDETPTPQPTASRTPTPTVRPSATPTSAATGPTPTPRGIGQPTALPTTTATPARTATPRPSPSATPFVFFPTATPTVTPFIFFPTATPTPTPFISFPTPISTSRPTATVRPTATPASSPSSTPASTSVPTSTPLVPTPTSLPTATPSSVPTATPTVVAPTATSVPPTATPAQTVGLAAPGCPGSLWSLTTFAPTTQVNGVSLCGRWAPGKFEAPPSDATASSSCSQVAPNNTVNTSWLWHDTEQLACHYWITANGVYAF